MANYGKYYIFEEQKSAKKPQRVRYAALPLGF